MINYIVAPYAIWQKPPPARGCTRHKRVSAVLDEFAAFRRFTSKYEARTAAKFNGEALFSELITPTSVVYQLLENFENDSSDTRNL